MKKALLILITLIFVGLSPNVNAQAESRGEGNAQGPGMVFLTPTISRGPGVTFDLTYRTQSLTGLYVISYQGKLEYDPTVIRYNGCSNIGTISVGPFLCNEPEGPGRVWFVYYHFAPLANAPGGPPSDLFKVNFTVVGSPGMVSPVTIADLMVMEYGVPASVVPGSVTVLAPTSASVSVGGRVADASGRPIRGARVVLADAQGGTRTALSGPFGYYQIDGVSAGQTYAVEASAKGYTFEPRAISVNDNLTDVDLTAQP